MAAPEKPEFVLFISSNCKFSNSFLTKLKEKPELIKKFNIVNIDKLPTIPNEVEEIPCVYDGKGIYMGKNAFKWLDDKSVEFLSPANDGFQYSFIDGNEERVFNNYSLLDQRNGSFGMGENAVEQKDPTRMSVSNDNTNKNRTMDSLMASRSEFK